MANVFVQDLELALQAKTRPHRPKDFEKVSYGQAYPRETLLLPSFSEQADCRWSNARLQIVFREDSMIGDCRVVFRSYVSSRVDPLLKLVNSRQIRKLHTFPHNSSYVYAIF